MQLFLSRRFYVWMNHYQIYAKLRIGLRGELKKLQKNLGITTIYVTHDQEEALMLSDKIAVFNNGYVEQVGTPQEIYNHSGSEFVCDFIGDIK